MTSVPEVRGDIAAFDHAISVVSNEIDGFATELNALRVHFGDLPGSWKSPSASAAGNLQDVLMQRCTTLQTRLGDVLERVRTTRRNYQNALDTNASMLGGGGA